MIASGPNSEITWRQAPQGEQGTPLSLVTATARISILGPNSATAEKIAVRSAQLVIPYEAFSTLHPAKISPPAVRIAAPTRNFEYGAWAFCIAFSARRSSFSRVSADSIFFGIREEISE